MSDAIETTAAGATRVFFGSLAFILLMVGVEGMRAAGIQFADIVLVLLGGLCFYAAVFWERAKRHLSTETQEAIGRFAQYRVTRFGMLFLVLQTVVFSPFIEQHRWPFSYPSDPAIIAENASLKIALAQRNTAFGPEKELADKWRFTTLLRRGVAGCGFQMQITSKASSAAGFWYELLQYGGWNEQTNSIALAPAPGSISSGITVRTTGSRTGEQCAKALQRAITDIYPNPPAKIANNQRSDFLDSCSDCVQIEIDY